MVFWEKPTGVGMNNFNIRREAVRQGNWKLIRDRSGKDLELYDLNTDIAEQNDLSPQYPEKVKELYEAFLTWKSEVYADSPMSLEEMILYLREEGVIK